jgi:hypothetical protein
VTEVRNPQIEDVAQKNDPQLGPGSCFLQSGQLPTEGSGEGGIAEEATLLSEVKIREDDQAVLA